MRNKKINIANEELFNSLYDFGDPGPKKRYEIVMERTTDRYAKVEGHQTKNVHCFYFMPDHVEAAEQLAAQIKTWQKERDHWVQVRVLPVKRAKQGDFVLHVQLISPSMTRATKYVASRVVPERDYLSLQIYIKTFIDMGLYPPVPVASASINTG